MLKEDTVFTSIRRAFILEGHLGHVGVPKQRNGGRVGVPANPSGMGLYYHANVLFCFDEKTRLLIT